MSPSKKFIDIGANLTDFMYQGMYNGSRKHEPDLKHVLSRAINAGLSKLIITGTDLESSKEALKLAENNEILFTTVGCHPTRCDEFDKSGDPQRYLHDLLELAQNNKSKVVAIGECGLDYDRLHFCKADVQKRYFEQQLCLSKGSGLPLFLHCRNAADDFISIVSATNYRLRGVVHSFDGTAENMKRLVELGFYIGINGCSLKTAENLEVVKEIPTDKLLIETDSPWCEVRPSHAGYKYVKTKYSSVKKEKWKSDVMIKSRNEPCTIIQVLEVISAIRDQNMDELCVQIYENTEKLFFKT